MAIEVRAIPTLEGRDAEEFIERAERAEKRFHGFKGIEDSPAYKSMRNILRKCGRK